MKTGRILLAALAVLIVSSEAGAAGPPQYTVSFLPDRLGEMLFGRDYRLYGINDRGEVVGHFPSDVGYPTARQVPVIWRDGQIQVLDTNVWGSYLASVGLSGNGLVVYASDLFGTNEYARSSLWDSGTLRPIVQEGLLLGDSVFAASVNNSGQVVGSRHYEDMPTGGWKRTAFLWQDGAFTWLGASQDPNYTEAIDINDSGQVVGGWLDLSKIEWVWRPVIWQDGAINYLPLPEGVRGSVRAINGDGDIIGGARVMQGEEWVNKGLLWREGVPTLLDMSLTDINDEGVIVGATADGAARWTNGVIENLNDLIDPADGVHLLRAYGINNLGQIVVLAQGLEGHEIPSSIVVLTPIPEPSSLALLATGLLLIPTLRPRRSR